MTNKQLVMSRRHILFTWPQANRFIRKLIKEPCYGNLENQSSEQQTPDESKTPDETKTHGKALDRRQDLD